MALISLIVWNSTKTNKIVINVDPEGVQLIAPSEEVKWIGCSPPNILESILSLKGGATYKVPMTVAQLKKSLGLE